MKSTYNFAEDPLMLLLQKLNIYQSHRCKIINDSWEFKYIMHGLVLDNRPGELLKKYGRVGSCTR